MGTREYTLPFLSGHVMERLKTFEEFWPFYVSQHSLPTTRALHFAGTTMVVGALAHAHARAGEREEALRLMGELKRIDAEKVGFVSPFGMIWAYAGLGDNDRAFAWLEKAYQEGYDRMVWLNVDPLLAPLRPDPRFADLVRRMGLPAPSSPQAR